MKKKTENDKDMEAKNEVKKAFHLDKFSIGFFGAIILLLLISLTLSVEETVPLTQKDIGFFPKIVQKIELVYEGEKSKNIEEINAYIDMEVHNIFSSVYNKLPAYVDTQYTWYRDYISMFQVAKKKGHEWWKIWKHFVRKEIYKEDIPPPVIKSESYAQKSLDEVQQVLLGGGEFDKQLMQFEMNANDRMKKLLMASKNTIVESLSAQELDGIHESNIIKVRELRKSIQGTFTAAKNDLEAASKIKSTGSIGLSAILTKTITTKLLAKSGIKVIAKSGGFWAGAATGLTICSPSGPWALACGAAVGTVTWIGVDFTVSKVDEAISREVFEKELTVKIKQIEDDYKKAMKNVYHQGINKTYKSLDKKMHSRPIDMLN